MLKNICFYNNKLFLILDGHLIAYRYTKYQKSAGENFSECLKIKLPVKYTSVIDSKLDVIDNYVTGLKSLLIFIFDTKGNWSIFIYNNTFRKKLHEIILPRFSMMIPDSLFVSDGPAFLFHAKDAFHLYYLPHCGKNYSYITLPFPDYEEFKVVQFKCFGPFKSSCRQCLFLLIVSCTISSQQSLKFFCFVSDLVKPVTSFEQLSISSFFPQCYKTALKSIEITKAIPHLKIDQQNIKNMEWKETASVICTENECLIFSNANLQYYCKLTLPLTDVMLMKTHFMSTLSGNINIIMTFENKCVFFIVIKKNVNSEVVKQWTDIEASIIGDILMKGSEQVLLLKQTDLNSLQNNATLFDISSFLSIEAMCHSSVPDSCLKATISGLERKVQVGISAIKDVESEISQKSSATIDALIKLNEYKVNTENINSSYTFQQSLVDLILSKNENKIKTAVAESELSVKLLEEKHRFIDNKWIISLLFINETERCICYPSIKLLKGSSQLTCIQKLFIYSSDDSFFASEYGTEINTKIKFYIVLTLENSVFHTEEDMFMVLSWYNGSAEELSNEVFIKEDKKVLTQNQICIQTRIILSNILKQCTPKAISSLSDLLFIRASQQRINFCVSSLHSDISKLEESLMKNDSVSSSLYLFENSTTKCIVFTNDNSPLYGVNFVIRKSACNVVEIGVFTRNGCEACLLVQYLYQHLPNDIIISPYIKFKDEQIDVKKNFALCMKNEIDLLMSALTAHNVSEEMRKSYTKLMSSQTVGTLTIPKNTYHRIRTVLVKKECITDTLFKIICFRQ